MQTLAHRLTYWLLAVGFFAATVAFAQETPAFTEPVPSVMGYVWQSVLSLAGIVATALMAIIGAAVQAKSKAGKWGTLISQLWVLVQAAVAHAEAELRPQFAKALEDGELTAEEGAALKAEVMRVLRETCAEQLAALVKSFQLPDSAVTTLLSGLVERAVALLAVTPVPGVLAGTAPSAPADSIPGPTPSQPGGAR
jgi:hypothetical protein